MKVIRAYTPRGKAAPPPKDEPPVVVSDEPQTNGQATDTPAEELAVATPESTPDETTAIPAAEPDAAEPDDARKTNGAQANGGGGHAPTPLEIALGYISRGWNPVPNKYCGKKPTLGDGWQKVVINAENASRYFGNAELNVGVMLGAKSGGLTDVDLDCAEALAIAPYILSPTGAIFGRESSRASHWLYVTTLAATETAAEINYDDPLRKRKAKPRLLELRTGGSDKAAQTVFPGSVHEDTGEPIKWEEDGEPAKVDGVLLKRKTALLATCALFARYWPGEGGRQDAALSIGGFLFRAGIEQHVIKVAMEGIARAAKDEEWRKRVEAAAMRDGVHARGYPTLKELFGAAVAKRAADWLDYEFGAEPPDCEFGTGRADDSEPQGEEADAAHADESTPPPQGEEAGAQGAGARIEPVDLWAKFAPPTLPRGLLPKLIEDFAFDRGSVMGCDMAGLAVGALVVCAASIPETIKLQPKRHDTEWQEAARLWATPVGGVSEMKSPMLNAVTKEMREIDGEMSRAYAKAMSAYYALPKPVQKVTPRPKLLRAKVMSTTVEACENILRDSPNGVLLEQDELSGWFGMMDKYSGARGAAADRAFWLQAYNGGSFTVDRVMRGHVHIPNLSVSILGPIQPELIRKLADGGVDDGLLQRFLPIVLRPAVAGRDEPPGQVVADYGDLIRRLRELRPPESGGPLPLDAPLIFDDGALKIREALEERHLELIKLKSLNRKLTSHIGKYNGIFARLCVIWHCVEHANDAELPPVVSEHTARRVAAFLHDFLLQHALAFYIGVLGLTNDHDRLANVADYILAHKLTRITNRDVQHGDRDMRDLKWPQTEAIFQQLEAFGWVTQVPAPRRNTPPHWVVNPVVHQKLAERAAAERKRREEEYKTISELLKGDAA